MEFPIEVDQGHAKIYRIAEKAFIGIVDEKVGYRKTSEDKPVLITFVSDDVESWYKKLKECGSVTSITDVEVKERFGIMGFFFEGPGGYSFEIQKFLDPEEQKKF